MITANTRKSNFCFTKIYVILTLAFILSLGTGATAYASEITTDTALESQQEPITIEEDSTDAQTTEQGVILGEGYYVDEQDQIYYDEATVTIEEPVIEDMKEDAEEEIEDQEASVVQDSSKENEETKAQEAKDLEKEAKQEKEIEIKKPAYSEAELRLLASLVYAEAGNQTYKGMLAVANVVINRAKSDVYWHVNTIKEVIYDHKWSVQFSVTIKSNRTGLSSLDKALKYYDTDKFTGANPEAEKTAMKRAIKAAKDALEGKNNIGSFLCFTYKNGTSSIRKKYPDYKIIGDHIFYRTK